jgi:hypothetical protein
MALLSGEDCILLLIWEEKTLQVPIGESTDLRGETALFTEL